MSALLILLVLQTTSAPIGMIMPSQGNVVIQRGGSKTPAKLADLLYPGDQVTSTGGQATFLYCVTAERVSIGNGTTVELTAAAVVPRAGPAPTKTPARCTLPKVALGSENLERIGGIRARGNPPIAIFVGGPVASARPRFEWAAVTGAATYHVRLTDAENIQVWQLQTSAVSLPYPDTAPDLKPGRYQWEVRAEGGGKTLAQQAAGFEVKPNGELARLAGADGASRLSNALELEEAGYFAEAAADYRELLRMYPDDPRIPRRLATLYWNAGLIAAANELIEKNKLK